MALLTITTPRGSVTQIKNGSGAVTARRREPEGTCFEVSFAQWNGEEVGR